MTKISPLVGPVAALMLMSGAAWAESALDSADLALDAALAEAEASCAPAILDLTLEAAAQVGVLVLAPCHAGERVVLDHAGMVLVLVAGAQGDLYLSMPVLAMDSPVTVTFEDGTMAQAPVMPIGLGALQDVAARW